MLSACASNQEFDQGLPDTETGQDNKELDASTGDDEGDATEPEADSDGAPEPEPAGTDPQDDIPDPQELRRLLDEHLASYCDLGSVSCYRMDELENQLLIDQGSIGLSINPQDSKLVNPDLDAYPFETALQIVQGYLRPQGLKTFTLPDQGIIGFDLWLKPNSASLQTRWNAFALDGFLSIQTISDGVIACKYNVGISPTFPTLPKPELVEAIVEFPKHEFVHVGCSYDGNNVSVWVNGVENKGPKHNRVILPETSRYLLNWSSAFQTPFDGQVGPVRVWHDIPTMRAQVRRLHQLLSVVD